jgi:tartrate dehydrogenase/decarboxylase/D-malate dehydrogenase
VAQRIAVIPGDGVGKEVIPVGLEILGALGLALEFDRFSWGCEHYERTGRMMPEDGLKTLASYDAIYLGAIGWPSVPDHVSLWGLLLPIRQTFDQYVNLRPVRLLRGVRGPLAGRGPEDVDMLFVRENTEGEYSGAGGRVHTGAAAEVAVEVPVFTRRAIERCARYALEQAQQRRRSLVSVTKSNASRYAYVLWDEVVAEVAVGFPDVSVERVHVDAMAARMVLRPETIDVVVASNLFGDVLTDLGAAIQGSLGLAASANLSVDGLGPSMFEPVHGSAPDIAGRGRANPIGAVWSAALMLRHLGHLAAAERVEAAVDEVCRQGVLTADLGGRASTAEVQQALLATLAAPGAPRRGDPPRTVERREHR